MIVNDDPNVYDRNDYRPVLKLTTKNAKNEDVPLTGMVDLYVWISATHGGPEIHADLKALATEMEIEGYYEVTILGASIHTRMFSTPPIYDEKDVFIVVRNNSSNVNGSERVRSFAVRPIRRSA